MANLTIRVSTTGAEYDVPEIDFSQVTPQQILDSMRETLPNAGQGMGWKILKGNQMVDQNVTLEELGFKDGETALLQGKVEGACSLIFIYI